MMPIFLNLFRSCLAIALIDHRLLDCSVFDNQLRRLRPVHLPFVMRKRLVGVRHAVRVFLLLDRVAAIVCSIQNFAARRSVIVFFAAPARVGDDPANRQRTTSFLVNSQSAPDKSNHRRVVTSLQPLA